MENLSAVDAYKQDASNVSTPIPGRTRFRALKLQHSRLDYARRKSATDLSSTEISCSEFSTSPTTFTEQPVNKTKSTSPSWFRRRFTLFSPEQSLSEISRNRQPLLAEKSFSDLLRHKRPSVIAQMMEVNPLMSPNIDRFLRHKTRIFFYGFHFFFFKQYV